MLFVDDEAKSRKYFSRIFGRDYEILVAEDGEEGVEMMNSEAGKEISVIVTDQIMPKMTGLDLLKVVSESRPKIVRVLSTAYTESSLVEEAVSSGLIDYFISKPWDIPKLEATLKQAAMHSQHNNQVNSSVA